jgi:hypothetical protein
MALSYEKVGKVLNVIRRSLPHPKASLAYRAGLIFSLV